MDGDAHVARLVEGRGDGPDGGPQGAAPAQEEQLGCRHRHTQSLRHPNKLQPSEDWTQVQRMSHNSRSNLLQQHPIITGKSHPVRLHLEENRSLKHCFIKFFNHTTPSGLTLPGHVTWKCEVFPSNFCIKFLYFNVWKTT